MANKY